MDSYSENTEWIDISEDILNVKFQETQSPIMEQNDNTEEKVSQDTRELIDSIVANIVDNAIETAQTDLYTEVETSSQNIPKEKEQEQEQEQEENNNGFYYDVFKLVSVLAGCRLFFEFIEWAN
jgi:ATP-dependent Zn protease